MKSHLPPPKSQALCFPVCTSSLGGWSPSSDTRTSRLGAPLSSCGFHMSKQWQLLPHRTVGQAHLEVQKATPDGSDQDGRGINGYPLGFGGKGVGTCGIGGGASEGRGAGQRAPVPPAAGLCGQKRKRSTVASAGVLKWELITAVFS
ncbi:hypothetical protein CB1_000966002 [Camelus ferus]|nr:hypothetical protein CB1_000966002 [Camelus ferus]